MRLSIAATDESMIGYHNFTFEFTDNTPLAQPKVILPFRLLVIQPPLFKPLDLNLTDFDVKVGNTTFY